MENTLKNKARFFAQYWGQHIGCNNYGVGLQLNKTIFGNITHLKLKTLSSITDEDALHVMKMFGSFNPFLRYEFITKSNSFNEVFRQVYFNDPKKDGGHDGTDSIDVYANFSNDGIHVLRSNRDEVYWRALDYLRSKGYALPYMGLSVEKQIEYGWIKLVTNV